MAKYYLTKDLNQNFEHVIHKVSCSYKPELSEMMYLGEFKEEQWALKESKKIAYKTNGCYWCCRAIHIDNDIEKNM